MNLKNVKSVGRVHHVSRADIHHLLGWDIFSIYKKVGKKTLEESLGRVRHRANALDMTTLILKNATLPNCCVF